MRSEYAEWLSQLSTIARADNIIVQAQHIDVLDYYYNVQKLTPTEAYPHYKKFEKRWMAITDNGQFTEAV